VVSVAGSLAEVRREGKFKRGRRQREGAGRRLACMNLYKVPNYDANGNFQKRAEGPSGAASSTQRNRERFVVV